MSTNFFANSAVNLPILRQRAHNYRWATQCQDVVPLTAADPDFPVAPAITDAIATYINSGYLSYGPAEGLPEFRDIAAQTVANNHGIPCCADQIFATNSAASALYLVTQLLLGPTGGDAIIFDPTDFLFERSIRAAGGSFKRLALLPQENYTIDAERLEDLIIPGRTKLISLCNPHNPLGRVWTRQELEIIAEIALRYDLWILSDEVWSDIVYAPHRHISIASLSPEIAQRTFSVFGFSKGYGLAGLRLGFIVSPDRATHKALVESTHAQDTAYGVSTLSQIAGIAAYDAAEDWLQGFKVHLQGQRDYAIAKLNQIPRVTCHVPEGTYLLFPDISALGLPPQQIVDILCEHYRVATIPGTPQFFGPGADGHLRLSFATSQAILTVGLDRLVAGLTDLSMGGYALVQTLMPNSTMALCA